MRLYAGPERPAAEIAVVAVPEAIEVVSVNGSDVPGTRAVLRKGDALLELAPGDYQVLAYYREIWQLGDQQDTLRSDPAIFEVHATAGGRYRLEYTHPKSYDEARRFSSAFNGWVEDSATGEKTATRASPLQFRHDLAGAFDSSTLVRKPTAQGGPAVTPLADSATLRTLQKDWADASPDERREFLRWASEHP